jgi:hypothetical protein
MLAAGSRCVKTLQHDTHREALHEYGQMLMASCIQPSQAAAFQPLTSKHGPPDNDSAGHHCVLLLHLCFLSRSNRPASLCLAEGAASG